MGKKVFVLAQNFWVYHSKGNNWKSIILRDKYGIKAAWIFRLKEDEISSILARKKIPKAVKIYIEAFSFPKVQKIPVDSFENLIKEKKVVMNQVLFTG